MISNKNTTSNTEVTSAAIEVEPVLKPKALVQLIEDRATLVINKNKIFEKKRKKNEKRKEKNKDKESVTDLVTTPTPASKGENIRSILEKSTYYINYFYSFSK